MITASFVRESLDVKLGISLKQTQDGNLIVSALPEYGVVAAQAPALQVGHRILTINNIDCTGISAEEAVMILRDATGIVTILADDNDVPIAHVEPSGDTIQAVAVQAAPRAVNQRGTTTTTFPPPGVKDGGIWGTNQYIGNITAGAACVGFLCFCLPGLLILCCPCDERDAYKVEGKVYDAAGHFIGNATELQFIPRRQEMHR